jgi:hypothetical protein
VQITLPQHAMKVSPDLREGNCTKQIGQSSALGGCLNNASSYNSAARLLLPFCVDGDVQFGTLYHNISQACTHYMFSD